MKIIFFGSSDFSIPGLAACLESGHEVVLAVTTPDRPAGRGLKAHPTPVKLFCLEGGIPCVDPESLKDAQALENARRLKPDIFVVSSYGKMIPSVWLLIPKIRFNIHPSLLPKYRGAAPIQWALLNGDPVTGVSIMEVCDRLDAGDVFAQEKVPLDGQINARELSARLADLSRSLLGKVFEQLRNGCLVSHRQEEKDAVYARKLEKSDGLIRWDWPALRIHNYVRGLLPWPVAFFHCGAGHVQILKSHVEDTGQGGGSPSEIVGAGKDGCLRVRTGEGILGIDRVKPAGKKEMSGADFANGYRLAPRTLLGE